MKCSAAYPDRLLAVPDGAFGLLQLRSHSMELSIMLTLCTFNCSLGKRPP